MKGVRVNALASFVLASVGALSMPAHAMEGQGGAAPAYAMLHQGGYVAFDPTKPLYVVSHDDQGRLVRYVLRPGARELVLDGAVQPFEDSGEFRLTKKSGKLRIYTSTPYDHLIRDASRRHGVHEALVRAVIHAESTFNPRAVSPKKAMGLMQLIPSTARRFNVDDPFDPAKNIDGGTRYLRVLLDMFGRIDYAVAAYNAGENRIFEYKGIPPFQETREYVDRVLNLFQGYKEVVG